MDARELGAALRARRAALGQTIASVAVDAGLSVPYIANLENARGNPTVGALSNLARALGVRLDVTLADDSTQEGVEPRDDARVEHLLRHPRLGEEAQRIATTSGRPLPQVREDLLAALATLSRLSPAPLTALDVDRLVDVVVLVNRRT